jgi:hypothetical protein
MGKTEYLVFSYRKGGEIYTKRGRMKKSIVQHTARGPFTPSEHGETEYLVFSYQKGAQFT